MIRHVTIAWRSHRPLESVRSWVSGSLLDTLRRAGYRMENETATANTAGGAPGTEWLLVAGDVPGRVATLLEQLAGPVRA